MRSHCVALFAANWRLRWHIVVERLRYIYGTLESGYKMTTDGSAIRLGDLLTGAGLLKPEDLREAMVIAKNQALPVGRVLIMSNYISEHNLQAAVQAQSLLKDGLIDLDTVLTALRGVTAEGVTLEQSLNNLGWSQKAALPTNKLGELLVEGGLITAEQLDGALKQCVSSGLPLGRVLVVTGLINEQLLTASLNAQILLRDQKVTREQALLGLKACRDRQISIEQSLTESGMMQLPTNETVRLGELLVSAGLLDESQLMHVVELGLINEQPVGQILIKLGLTNETTLSSALSIQAMVASGSLKKSDSGQALANANSKGISAEEAAREFQPNVLQPVDPIPLYQFLQLAGIIGPKDIEDALKVGSRDSDLMGKMLMLSGKLEQPLLTAALSCNDLITQGYLKSEQGIIAIGVCHKNNCSLDSAFLELGWNLAAGPVTGPAPVQAAAAAPVSQTPVAQDVVQSAQPFSQEAQPFPQATPQPFPSPTEPVPAPAAAAAYAYAEANDGGWSQATDGGWSQAAAAAQQPTAAAGYESQQVTGPQPVFTSAASEPQATQPAYNYESSHVTPPPQPAYDYESSHVTPPPQPAYNYESSHVTPPPYHQPSPTMEVNEPDLGVQTSPTVGAIPVAPFTQTHDPMSIVEASSRTMDVPIVQHELTGEAAEPPPPEKPRKRLADLVPNTRPPSAGGGSNTNPGVNI